MTGRPRGDGGGWLRRLLRLPPPELRTPGRAHAERPAHKGDFLESFENMPGSQVPPTPRTPPPPPEPR